jgi:hypothetical protein
MAIGGILRPADGITAAIAACPAFRTVIRDIRDLAEGAGGELPQKP